ncbi:MAG: hypothetical protein N3I35_16030 [Clostridia bacterium]|nr:hypothetical protein [Clostridia bacterium]
MSPTFWTNTIWYVLLGITSVVASILIIRKPDCRKFNIAFTFTTLGFVYSAESILLGFYGGAYNYYPKISKDAFLDTVMGNHFSQLSICTTLVLLVIYKSRTIWNFISAVIYYLIEILFLKLGVYQHNWYKAWITLVGLIVLAFLFKKWYYKLLNSPKFLTYYFALYFAVVSSYGLVRSAFVYGKFRIINYNVFPNVFKDNLILVHIPLFIIINIMIYVYQMKLSWFVKCMVFSGLFLTQFILTKIGVITIRPGWFLTITSADVLSCYLIVVIMDSLLKSGTKNFSNC